MNNSSKRIFITGIAGFIGMHLALELTKRGNVVTGCDNFSDYYDPHLKKQRASLLPSVCECDINDQKKLQALVEEHETTHLIHLAAQAGVRHSIDFPSEYHEANSVGFFNVLEVLRKNPHIKFTFASSSSIYGLNKKIPFCEDDPTDKPSNFYGATKKCNELMAFAYHNLYGISTNVLRFFTVYGPYGRPDMAYSLFTQAILEDRPIKLFNYGKMRRDFTYIDDIISGTIAAIDYEGGFEVFNLGNNQPEDLMNMVHLIENFLGKKAKTIPLPMPQGEVAMTFADISKAQKLLNFRPKITLEEGMARYLKWAMKGQFAQKR